MLFRTRGTGVQAVAASFISRLAANIASIEPVRVTLQSRPSPGYDATCANDSGPKAVGWRFYNYNILKLIVFQHIAGLARQCLKF